jgi:cytochrome d ubiquinol oxidase subunit II
MSSWYPFIFVALMGLAMLVYVVLDGYDLGVGILLRGADDADKDTMIASIGPFWDANETWLVLGVGILLVAFPLAHGVILGGLYLPVAFMLIGLILRGVAFDFRVKAHDDRKPLWNLLFHAGSVLAAFAQGFMLGLYILGFAYTPASVAFALGIGFSLLAGYALLGACWLILKTEGALYVRAVRWARAALWLTGLGIAAVSLATPLVSERIFAKWFTPANLLLLSPIPLLTAWLFLICERALRRLASGAEPRIWIPFACAVGMFVLSFAGLAYSLFPFLVVDRITYLDAASAPESLGFMLVGVAITLPAIIGYTAWSYRVFWGKARELRY